MDDLLFPVTLKVRPCCWARSTKSAPPPRIIPCGGWRVWRRGFRIRATKPRGPIGWVPFTKIRRGLDTREGPGLRTADRGNLQGDFADKNKGHPTGKSPQEPLPVLSAQRQMARGYQWKFRHGIPGPGSPESRSSGLASNSVTTAPTGPLFCQRVLTARRGKGRFPPPAKKKLAATSNSNSGMTKSRTHGTEKPAPWPNFASIQSAGCDGVETGDEMFGNLTLRARRCTGRQ